MTKANFIVLSLNILVFYGVLTIFILFGIILCDSHLKHYVVGTIAEKHIEVVDSDTIYSMTIIPKDTITFLPKVTVHTLKDEYTKMPLGYSNYQKKVLYNHCLRDNTIFQTKVFFAFALHFLFVFFLMTDLILYIMYYTWKATIKHRQPTILDKDDY